MNVYSFGHVDVFMKLDMASNLTIGLHMLKDEQCRRVSPHVAQSSVITGYTHINNVLSVRGCQYSWQYMLEHESEMTDTSRLCAEISKFTVTASEGMPPHVRVISHVPVLKKTKSDS